MHLIGRQEAKTLRGAFECEGVDYTLRTTGTTPYLSVLSIALFG